MAIFIPDFRRQEPATSPLERALSGLMDGAEKGYGYYRQSKLDKEESELNELRKALMKAQADKAKASAAFGGDLTGTAQERFGIELLRRQFGENSPVYQDALKSYNSKQQGQQILQDYRQKLMGTQDKRSATPLGKLQAEIEAVKQGYHPTTGRELMPDEQSAMLNAYQGKLAKEVSDTKTRERTLFATNIDKTLDQINVNDLVKYAGTFGKGARTAEEIKSAGGKPSEEFIKFKEAVVGADILAKQVRQFYGDSITPQIQEKLANLSNPDFWASNPEVAKRMFNKFKDILKSETETYKAGTQGGKIYQGYSSPNTKLEEKIVLRNKNTGVTEEVTIEEARRRGVNV